MKVVAIIQARMGSTRLPGKVLKEVLGKPLLEYQIERVRRAKLIDDIVIATTINESEQPIINFCDKQSLHYYRGSEDDVLSRYYEAAVEHNADVIVRLTSDCPIIDPDVIDKVVQYYLDNMNKYDYVSNTLKRTYPRGYDTEVFSFKMLKKSHMDTKLPSEREHVTPYMYRYPGLFNVGNVLENIDNSNLRFTVDTREDFYLIEKIIELLYQINPEFSYHDVVTLMNKNPGLIKINSQIIQKEV